MLSRLSRAPKHHLEVLSSRFYHADTASTTKRTARPFEEIPGPRALPFIGSAYQYIFSGGVAKSFKVHKKNFDRYGPIFKDCIGLSPFVFVADPKEIEKVHRLEGKYPDRSTDFPPLSRLRKERGLPLPLVSLEGKEWFKVRQAIAPKIMRPKQMVENLPNFNAVAEDAVKSLGKKRGNGKTKGVIPDLEHELILYTTEAIGTFVFDARFGAYSDPPNADALTFVKCAKIVNKNFIELMFGIPDSILYTYFDTPKWKALCKAHDENYRIGEKLVKAKMEEIEKSARDLEISVQDDTTTVPLLTYMLITGKLTPNEVVTHSIDMFAAGVDTTSVTLLWLLYNIARRPEVQDTLVTEIKSVGDQDGNLTAEHLLQIPYMRACLKESMRMFPPFTGNSRRLNEDIEMCGYHIPAKTPIVIAMYHPMHSSEQFKNPNEFIPKRWLRGDGEETHPFAYLPFGFGPRMCVGKRAAELEIFLYVTKLLQRYRIECDHDPPEQTLGLILEPEKPMNINLIDRGGS